MAEMRDIRITKGAPADRGAPSSWYRLLTDAIERHWDFCGRRPEVIHVSPLLWHEMAVDYRYAGRGVLRFLGIRIEEDCHLDRRDQITTSDPGHIQPRTLKITQAEFYTLFLQEPAQWRSLLREYDEITIITGRR